MPLITLRVLDGADRGRVFERLPPPVTIGREEGNTIQLNDERVSRYHVKIQEDNDRLVLTDLDSTNGTKVNGESTSLRNLRVGDMITVGRSVLLYGSRDEIAARLADLREGEGTLGPAEMNLASHASALDFELNWNDDADLQATLHSLEPPPLPERLTPGQAAQLVELLEYLHIRLRNLLKSAEVQQEGEQVLIEFAQWQNLIDLQARLAEYVRRVGDPNGD